MSTVSSPFTNLLTDNGLLQARPENIVQAVCSACWVAKHTVTKPWRCHTVKYPNTAVDYSGQTVQTFLSSVHPCRLVCWDYSGQTVQTFLSSVHPCRLVCWECCHHRMVQSGNLVNRTTRQNHALMEDIDSGDLDAFSISKNNQSTQKWLLTIFYRINLA